MAAFNCKNVVVSMVLSCLAIFAMPTDAQACATKVLMSTDSFPQIQQGRSVDYGGIVLVQQFGGNLQVYTGSIGNLTCLIWESGKSELPSNRSSFLSTLTITGTLETTSVYNGTSSTFFTTSSTAPNGTYYFLVDCNGVVGIYNSTTPTTETAIWQHQGNACGLTPRSTCRRTVLMKNNQNVQVNQSLTQGTGAFIYQEDNGNVVVKRGTPSAPQEALWQSCYRSPTPGKFVTSLQEDAQFITRPSFNSLSWVWKRGGFTADTSEDWELALECVGDDYGKIVISDATGAIVAWDRSLRPSCDTTPVCSTAIPLLMTDQTINNGTLIETGKNYTLQQQPDGTLQLWQGVLGGDGCVVWQTTPSGTNIIGAYTIIQSDGNLVTYGIRSNGSKKVVWKTQTALPQQDSYSFVINNCGSKAAVAIYQNNPITESNATLLWSEELTNSCKRRKLLRGLDGASKDDIQSQGTWSEKW